MNVQVITLFPDMFHAITQFGITRRAIANDIISLGFINPRDFTQDAHKTVDDRPYGGGPGMVMKAEPLAKAIDSAKSRVGPETKVIYLSPQGKKLTQQTIKDLSKAESLILLAGRYEGIDERLLEVAVDEEYSIGDYVVSGGELPAMILLDAMIRMLPGALGDDESSQQDSFMNGLLDYPHYTRPPIFAGKAVPEVLMSGNHEAIRRWRMQEALKKTWLRRQDLIKDLTLTPEQEELLAQFCDELVRKGDV